MYYTYPPTPAIRGSASEEQCRLLPRAMERWAQDRCAMTAAAASRDFFGASCSLQGFFFLQWV